MFPNKNVKQPTKINVQLHMRPNMIMWQKTNASLTMLKNANQRMDMVDRIVNQCPNRSATRLLDFYKISSDEKRTHLLIRRFFLFQISEKVPKQIPKQSCQQVPRQSCSTQYKSVPKQSCSQVPRKKCRSIPRQHCIKVPIQVIALYRSSRNV